MTALDAGLWMFYGRKIHSLADKRKVKEARWTDFKAQRAVNAILIN